MKLVKLLILKIIQKLDDKWFTLTIFLLNCIRCHKLPYQLNFKNPRTFNEKINYIKFHVRNELSSIVADKIKVREYVKAKIGEHYLIPLLELNFEPNDDTIERLPNKFVIKLNNGSGFNWLVRDKSQFEWNKFIAKKNKIKKIDFYKVSREWHYATIQNEFFIEEYLGDSIIDYKFFCSKSSGPYLIQVDTDRFNNHKRNLFDLNWEEQEEIEYVYKRSNEKILKPKKLDEMISICSELSKDFLFCRVDLYEINGKIYFGEITLHPEGGLGPFRNYDMDLKMGNLLVDI